MEKEDENLTPHPDYVKGFNEGYLLAEHRPELAGKLSEAMKDTERGQGFSDGSKQFALDKEREPQRETSKTRNQEQEQCRPKDKDRGLDPDR